MNILALGLATGIIICTATALAQQQQPARFPAIEASVTGVGMSPSERAALKHCKTEAERVYDTALGNYPPGSYLPDMVAVQRLRDCLTYAPH